MMTDEALANYLGHRTALDPSSGNSDTARIRRCPGCGARVLVGLDDSVCAFRAVADPTPLDPLQELAALLLTRDTYRLHSAPKVRLRRRDRWQIAALPAGVVVVLPEHSCGHPLAAEPEPKPSTTMTERIPY